jgi:hypothetical protein
MIQIGPVNNMGKSTTPFVINLLLVDIMTCLFRIHNFKENTLQSLILVIPKQPCHSEALHHSQIYPPSSVCKSGRMPTSQRSSKSNGAGHTSTGSYPERVFPLSGHLERWSTLYPNPALVYYFNSAIDTIYISGYQRGVIVGNKVIS